jgi:hypothetical protein
MSAIWVQSRRDFANCHNFSSDSGFLEECCVLPLQGSSVSSVSDFTVVLTLRVKVKGFI